MQKTESRLGGYSTNMPERLTLEDKSPDGRYTVTGLGGEIWMERAHFGSTAPNINQAMELVRRFNAHMDALDALRMVTDCLEQWMEIADKEDQREGDYEALAAAKAILSKTPLPKTAEHTENGYDPGWIDCINSVLRDRDSEREITDLNDAFWDTFIGPMIDAVQDDPDGDWKDIVIGPMDEEEA